MGPVLLKWPLGQSYFTCDAAAGADDAAGAGLEWTLELTLDDPPLLPRLMLLEDETLPPPPPCWNAVLPPCGNPPPPWELAAPPLPPFTGLKAL